jgi:hypothetical protein
VVDEMRKAMPSEEERQEGDEWIEKEKRYEKEAVEFVTNSMDQFSCHI